MQAAIIAANVNSVTQTGSGRRHPARHGEPDHPRWRLDGLLGAGGYDNNHHRASRAGAASMISRKIASPALGALEAAAQLRA